MRGHGKPIFGQERWPEQAFTWKESYRCDEGRLGATRTTCDRKRFTVSMTSYDNLFAGPPPTRLPDDVEPRTMLETGTDPAEVAAKFPESSLAWAVLADEAFKAGRVVESYAYARTGYHRALDALRRNGWKGHGPVPWDHEPNRGFLRSLHALARAAQVIGETGEAERCRTFLRDSSPEAAEGLDV